MRALRVLLLLLWISVCWIADVSASMPPDGAKADYIIIEKSKRRLTLLSKGQVLKSYPISLGRNPVGTKIREGDDRTPEGVYRIDYRLDKSRYHRALHISYPSKRDRERARQLGVRPGGDIMIHGIGQAKKRIEGLHLLFDWTNGCIAVTDQEIEEIWRMTPVGTVVNIIP